MKHQIVHLPNDAVVFASMMGWILAVDFGKYPKNMERLGMDIEGEWTIEVGGVTKEDVVTISTWGLRWGFRYSVFKNIPGRVNLSAPMRSQAAWWDCQKIVFMYWNHRRNRCRPDAILVSMPRCQALGGILVPWNRPNFVEVRKS